MCNKPLVKVVLVKVNSDSRDSVVRCPPPVFGASVGSEMVEAQCQRFEVRSADGERFLFSADEEEISIGTEKLRVTGRSTHTDDKPQREYSKSRSFVCCFVLCSLFVTLTVVRHISTCDSVENISAAHMNKSNGIRLR